MSTATEGEEPPRQHALRLPPSVVICGPTAAGKTEIALALARAVPVRLISADSVQVYRGMNVGSAKPEAALLSEFPHDLIDIRDPEDSYTAADFARDAETRMRAAAKCGRIPVLVGGTAMYLRALRYGLDPLPEADPALREQLEAEAARDGWAALHRRLAGLDPK
ncbi:MAG: tRNA (adenosine(37)-N6)-dimethylallyltransferase MiaA, partial [Wenzhouxiangellaceae bacterium]